MRPWKASSCWHYWDFETLIALFGPKPNFPQGTMHHDMLMSPSMENQSKAIERPLEPGIPRFSAQTQVPLYLLPSLPQATSTPPSTPLPTASCPGWANSCKQQDSAISAAIPCSSDKTLCGGLPPQSRSSFNHTQFMQFISEKQTGSFPTVGLRDSSIFQS